VSNYFILNPHNDQEYRALLRRVISNARAIITYQVGLPFGCLRMHRLFLQLQPRRTLEFPVFEEYLMVVRPFAFGQDRLHWNRQALFEQDREVQEINRDFRDPVHNACHDLIEQLAAESEEPL